MWSENNCSIPKNEEIAFKGTKCRLFVEEMFCLNLKSRGVMERAKFSCFLVRKKRRVRLTFSERSTRMTRSITAVLLKNAFCGHGGAVAWFVSKFNVLKPLWKSQYWFSLEFSVPRTARGKTYPATSPLVKITSVLCGTVPFQSLIPRKWLWILIFWVARQKRDFSQPFPAIAKVLWGVSLETC